MSVQKASAVVSELKLRIQTNRQDTGTASTPAEAQTRQPPGRQLEPLEDAEASQSEVTRLREERDLLRAELATRPTVEEAKVMQEKIEKLEQESKIMREQIDKLMEAGSKAEVSHWRSVGQKLGDLFTFKKAVSDEKKPKEGEESAAEKPKEEGSAAEKPKEEGTPQKSMGEKMKETLTTTPEWAKQMQESTNAYVLANKAGISWTLGPAEQTKIGKVITRMKEAEYSEESSIAVVKALFTDCSEEELKAAFAVFSPEGKDSMSKENFTKAMPIMGEDVPADKVEEAFKLVDANGSGELDLSEFTSLIEMVNPRKAKKPEEAPTEQAKESASATIANKWTEFTSRFTSKKEEAPAAEAPETKATEPNQAESEKTPATVDAK